MDLSAPPEQQGHIARSPDGLRCACAARLNGPVVAAKIWDVIENKRGG